MESPVEPPPLDLESAKSLSRDAAEMMRAGKNDSALVLLLNVEGFMRKTKCAAATGKLAETVHANIGGCYLNLGDTTKAVKYLTKALGFSSGVQQAPALVNLSFAHYRLGDFETALLESFKAIRLYESAPRSCHEEHMHAKALLIVAMCQEAAGHHQKAIVSYFRALCFAIEKLPHEDDLRDNISTRYEALLRRHHSSTKPKDPSAPLLNSIPKLRLKAPRKSKPSLRPDFSSTLVLAKPLRNPVLHLKQGRKEPTSTRAAVHQKAAFSHDYTFSENTNSESMIEVKQPLSHRSKEEQGSLSSLFENSDVEDRIVSIGEKLEGLTLKLREYGDKNRLLELKAAPKQTPESPSKRTSIYIEPKAKRSLFRVNSISRTLGRPASKGKTIGRGDPKYAMYRLS